MDQWKIELWETDDGICRVGKDLLNKMRKSDSYLYKSLAEKMLIYIQKPINNVILAKDIEKVKGSGNMWELKFHLPKNNQIRFLGCLVLDKDVHIFYALHAFKKKEQIIKNKYKYIAESRIKEFLNNLNKNEHQKIL